MDKYYVDISLRRWAMIQYAKHVWQRPELKKHAEQWLCYDDMSCDQIVVIPTELHEELDKLPLPRSLKDELKLAIDSMGMSLHDSYRRTWLQPKYYESDYEDLYDPYDLDPDELEYDDPGYDEHDYDDRDYDEPEYDERDYEVSEHDERDYDEPEYDERDYEVSENDEHDYDEREYDESECDERDDDAHCFDKSEYDARIYDEHDYDESEYDEPEYDESEYDESEYDEPEYDEHDYDEPEYDEHDYDEPEYDEHDYDEPEYDEHDYDEPEHDEYDYEDSSYYKPLVKFIDYMDHVQWNYLGCVNLIETTKSLYKSGILPMIKESWLRLCDLCVEDCIVDFWKKSSRNNESNVLMKDIYSVHDFTSIYWRRRMQNKLHDFDDEMRHLNDLITLDELMIAKSYHPYYNEAFKYFWNRLDDDQRRSTLQRQINSDWSIVDLCHGRFTDLDHFMFLIRQYFIYGLEEVITNVLESSPIVDKVLVWPWYDNFIPILEASGTNHSNWQNIMISLLNLASRESALSSDDSRLRKWFDRVWHEKDVCEVGTNEIDSLVSYILRENRPLWELYAIYLMDLEGIEKLWGTIVTFLQRMNIGNEYLLKYIRKPFQKVGMKEWFELKLSEVKATTNVFV